MKIILDIPYDVGRKLRKYVAEGKRRKLFRPKTAMSDVAMAIIILWLADHPVHKGKS